MRLATARDELEPLRDPTVQGPDDPRLTILVLTRVVETLGTLDVVSSHVIEGLFAVDLAFLQDFYGVINFGSQEEYDALLAAQRDSRLLGTASAASTESETPEPAAEAAGPGAEAVSVESAASEPPAERPSLRRSVEELPRRTS